ncbi:DNA recombination protein RmuC, partial [Acinetobacter baumannii]|uniref:DNA recombination protein RmuC n=1 Tax=Acinetobacter baumannii TaxID=470 RepID=UPI0031F3A461
EALLQPLGRDIDRFRTQFVSGHASLDSYIKSLIAQTQTLGRDAENLAKALKGNNKLQGNWGEAVLDNLLATSG